MGESELRAALGLALELLKHPEDAPARLIFADALEQAGCTEAAQEQRATALHELRKWKQLLAECWGPGEMEERNKEVGGHWFDLSSKRFFGSRVGNVYQGCGGVYFVSSEKDFPGTGRFYSVRSFDPITGMVGQPDSETFQQHASSRTANRRAQALAAGEPSAARQKLMALLASLNLD